uniref:ATP synthase YMF19 uncharacterized C-terminal domain-containing protein n=1 Tax=Oryza rufipogon TaxID=4529 RepID=A0A0E0RI20_ORYRU
MIPPAEKGGRTGEHADVKINRKKREILKLRNQLLSHRGNKIRFKDPKNLEDISRKGFSTGLSYMYSSLSEVSQWCKTVDYLGKRRKITLISDFGEISGSRGMERQILYLISKSSYNTSSSRITWLEGGLGARKVLSPGALWYD